MIIPIYTDEDRLSPPQIKNSRVRYLYLIRKTKQKMKDNLRVKSRKDSSTDSLSSQLLLEEDKIKDFRKFCFSSKYADEGQLSEIKLKEKAKQILEFALSNGIQHYSFLSFPHTSGICEKHESFIELSYYYDSFKLRGLSKADLIPELLLKGQADGSSFPGGGLRGTHHARAYMLWDQKSEIFIRKRNKVLYIPSLLVTHSGQPLDDKTLFRKAEAMLETSCKKLLSLTGTNAKSVKMFLGLEQQFFAIPKKAYTSRVDLTSCGRTLVGYVAPKNQQFSDHYYGKMPTKIQSILCQVQNQLLEIGIPFKTKHNQVATNQFQFCSIYEEAGKAIDHNMIVMQVLKEAFDRHGYSVLLNEKPFKELNGSGKHANWSLNFIDENLSIKNLFSIPKNPEQTKRFRLFILLNLMAILRNSDLYLNAIATPGNEIRLGGHQAPPRILSVYLGSTISAILDGKQVTPKKNLKEDLFFLANNVLQEDTDRNRTSPYVYTGNKFEFRAVGSSQNPSFVMAVIAGTLTKEIQLAVQRIEKGETIDQIIDDLTEATKIIRFQGNGYSQEWVQEAKKRGLYVNEHFSQIYSRMEKAGDVFKDIGIYSQIELKSRVEVAKSLYVNTVDTQAKAIIQIAHKNIIPKSYDYLARTNVNLGKKIKEYSEKVVNTVDKMLQELEIFENIRQKTYSVEDYCTLRKEINKLSSSINDVIRILPKDQQFPNISEFLFL